MVTYTFVDMRIRFLWVIVGLLTTGASAAVLEGMTRWVRPIEVDEVLIRVHWVTRGEMKVAARGLGARLIDDEVRGFAALRRHVVTGAYSCDIYLPHRTLETIEDRQTRTLGHEAAHCLGFNHE